MQLRPDQLNVQSKVFEAWANGYKNVAMVCPMGAGKTVIFTNTMSKFDTPSVAIAHRAELVSQMSLTLARNGVHHRIIGSKDLIKEAVRAQHELLGKSFYSANSHSAVASVDTLVNMNPHDVFFKRIGLWVTDECHHLLKKNKWGKAAEMFTNAVGLGVTATLSRSDGLGLGRHADGILDTMIFGPIMRELIIAGHLSDYKIYTPESDLDLSTVPLSTNGDYSYQPLRNAVHKSQIVGDAVKHYLRFAPGKLGITFTVDIEDAERMAAMYRHAGIPSAAISGKTPPATRAYTIAKFARGDLKQLCACDIISEGFDLPACEVATFCRPTKSYNTFAQQFGRPLRYMDGKTHGIIIDPVRNVYGGWQLPDNFWDATLDRREKASRSTPAIVTLRTCPTCAGVYEKYLGTECPYCKTITAPISRRSIEQVDGDLRELDADVLSSLRGKIDAPLKIPNNATPAIEGRLNKLYNAKMQAQTELRNAMAIWAGKITSNTDPDSVAMMQRRFYLKYGIDVLSAQALNANDANVLLGKILNERVD